MSVLQELDELLCGDDEEYERLDLFLEADELIRQLQSGAVLRALLAGLLQIKETTHGVFELMTRLPPVADTSPLSEALLDYAEQAWHADQQWRRQIQISCWSCGLSGRLLKRLGLSSWKDAGL